MSRMLAIVSIGTLLATFGISTSAQQQADLADIERKLDQSMQTIKHMGETIDSLRAEVNALKEREGEAPATAKQEENSTSTEQSADEDEFLQRIIGTDLGKDEHDHPFSARPETFIQSRYSVAPIPGSESAFDPNFRISRAEMRWAGKVSNKLGAGIELQYQEAPEGVPESLLNDAFVELYVNEHATLRSGQFIKPFGFDVEQSSAVRESPERAMFSGYFFPGERDRGIMLFGDLGFLKASIFHDLQYYLAVLNGNRFFNDNNRQLNYIVRVRKVFDKNFAVGTSVQLGKQILPPGMSGNDNERIFGADFQFAFSRFGFRGEVVAGNMPSTSVFIEPRFFSSFRPGAHSEAGSLLADYRLAGSNNVYVRYNRFNGDPQTGQNVRAIDLGYFRSIGRLSRLNLDYQFKNRPSFEDDAVNARFQITWQIFLETSKESEKTSIN
jgi:hypothetical protein